MPTVHWLGAGLSSVPGIRRMATSGRPLVLWNRTLSKAESAVVGLNSKNTTCNALDWNQLEASISPGDVVVSMLPASLHLNVAKICLAQKAHFVSSSYISTEMRLLNECAVEQNVCLVNEVGLDPGIDHLMAHVLVSDYRRSEKFSLRNRLNFRSYCGGFPKFPNEFRYKFSWSPLGVLRALKSPAKWIQNGESTGTERPWQSVEKYSARLPSGMEIFEAYPNRDSTPFLAEYGFESDWNVQQFVRGTLRLNGWTDAWKDIFALVEEVSRRGDEASLIEKSNELWEEYRYGEDDPDRVVLTVELQAEKDEQTVWHEVYCLDAIGNETGSAMSRLVSLTTSIAVDAVLDGGIGPGVSGAPNDSRVAADWIQRLQSLGEEMHRIKLS